MARKPRRQTKALRSKADQIKTPRGKPGPRSRAKKAARAKPVAKATSASPSREKVRAYRQRMRAKGLRLVQMWLPDTRTEEFAAQAHRDSLAIANSQTEQDDQAFIDSISWWNSEESIELANSEPPAPWWREPEKPR